MRSVLRIDESWVMVGVVVLQSKVILFLVVKGCLTLGLNGFQRASSVLEDQRLFIRIQAH